MSKPQKKGDAQRIINLIINKRMTITDACKKEGVSRTFFYNAIRKMKDCPDYIISEIEQSKINYAEDVMFNLLKNKDPEIQFKSAKFILEKRSPKFKEVRQENNNVQVQISEQEMNAFLEKLK